LRAAAPASKTQLVQVRLRARSRCLLRPRAQSSLLPLLRRFDTFHKAQHGRLEHNTVAWGCPGVAISGWGTGRESDLRKVFEDCFASFQISDEMKGAFCKMYWLPQCMRVQKELQPPRQVHLSLLADEALNGELASPPRNNNYTIRCLTSSLSHGFIEQSTP
jgi:hypothetical protein